MKKIVSAFLSVLFWGSGQFFICRQRVKGLIFFAMQLVFVGVELGTGYWLDYISGRFQNFEMRLHGGFFTKGLWGLFSLGEVSGAKGGDHSTMLMIQGIIVGMVFLMAAGVFVWNVKDAYRTAEQIEKTKEYMTSLDYGRKLYKNMFEYIVLAPVILILLFVVIMPILFSMLTAFTNYNRDHLPPANLVQWVGFDNFKKLFDVPIWSNTFFSVFGWTMIWAVCTTATTYFVGLFQALILNSKYAKCKTLFRTILILPWAVPQMISLLVFKNLLNGQFGPINQFLMDIGLISERIPFLTDPTLAKVTVILVNLWLGFPMFMVMLLGVLGNVDPSLYEAAAIDGASNRQRFSKITLPLVLKATAPLLIMNFAGNFNGFGSIYFLTEGGPANPAYQFAGDTDILISWIYKLTLNQQMFNMAAVMSLLIFLLIGTVSFWNFRRTNSFKEM